MFPFPIICITVFYFRNLKSRHALSLWMIIWCSILQKRKEKNENNVIEGTETSTVYSFLKTLLQHQMSFEHVART